MGMFDALRKKLKGFGKQVEDEVAKDLPAEPAKPSKPSKAAPGAPKDDDFDEDLERELAEIEAEVDAERRGEPAKPVARPAVEPPKPEPKKAERLEKPREIVTHTRQAEAAEATLQRAPQSQTGPPARVVAPPPKTMPAPPPKAKEAKAAPAPPKPSGKGIALRADRMDELLWDLELMLLESDIAVPVVEAIKEHLQKSLGKLRADAPGQVQGAVEGALKDALRDVLSAQLLDFDEYILNAKKPVRIMFVGVNGTGKTTTIARIAHRLKQNGYSSVLAAGDTFRAGAIEQISLHSDRLGLTVIKHSAGADPAAVAHDAIEHANSRRKDVVLIDTAGRMQTNTNLMDEMKKIKRVAQPDMIVFIGDALAGNDAVEQARKFDEAVGIHAAILTKVDTDSKGGAALSIAHAVGKPILFLGVGQEYGDLIPFDPEWVIARIFGE